MLSAKHREELWTAWKGQCRERVGDRRDEEGIEGKLTSCGPRQARETQNSKVG